jgi:hypothetical protein
MHAAIVIKTATSNQHQLIVNNGDRILERLSTGTKTTNTSQYDKTTALNGSCNKVSYIHSQLTNAVWKIAYQPLKEL